MLITQINNQYFTGNFETNKNLANKLNNIKELNKLAEVANVDKIRTYIKDDSKYLPRNNSFVTMTSKKVNNRIIHGFDCILLDKKTDNETLSKKVFESAQRSLGKLYGNIATDTKNQVFSTPNSNPKPQNTFSKIISKITNIFKK